MPIILSPSMLSCDFARMAEEAAAMKKAGVEMLHLDVMDAHFVPNLTFGAPVIQKLRPHSDLIFDTHLMISDPLRYAGDFARAGSDIITFHLESDSDVRATIDEIRKHGKKAGLSVKPGTAGEAVFPYLPLIDMALVMTVEPGFGGQKFMADMLPKIRAIRGEIKRLGLSVDIQVDGGIDPATAPLVAEAGANVLVAGSAIFAAADTAAAAAQIRRAAESACQK